MRNIFVTAFAIAAITLFSFSVQAHAMQYIEQGGYSNIFCNSFGSNGLRGRVCVEKKHNNVYAEIYFNGNGCEYDYLNLRDDSWSNGRGKPKGKTVASVQVDYSCNESVNFSGSFVTNVSIIPGHSYHAYTSFNESPTVNTPSF